MRFSQKDVASKKAIENFFSKIFQFFFVGPMSRGALLGLWNHCTKHIPSSDVEVDIQLLELAKKI
jgi:hypothetical protein